MISTRSIVACAALILLAGTLAAAPAVTSPAQRAEAYARHQRMADDSPFHDLHWRSLGPTFQGGRISAIACPDDGSATVYAAAGSGGVWKSVNNGTTWTPIFNHESTFAIGALAVAPGHPGIIWAGTGEELMARSSYAGTGVFKSVDGGGSWSDMGLADTQHINRIVIDPRNPEVVYVAAIGHLYSENEQRGLFKTTDGGRTWHKILYIGPRTGVVDVVMDPRHPDVLYAAAWENLRRPWNYQESGPGSGLYKSTDAGATWTRLTNGFPTGKFVGKIGLAVSASNPDVVYALLDNQAPRPAETGKKETAAENKEAEGLTILHLKSMSREDFLALDDKKLEGFLRQNGVPRDYHAADVKGLVRRGEISPPALAQYLLDLWADLKLHVTNVIGAEIYRSADRGATWHKMNEHHLETFFNTYGYSFADIRVAPDNPDQIFILGIRLFTSTDAGRTFKHIGGPTVHLDHHALWIDPRQPDHLIEGNDGGINISWDRGRTWENIRTMPIGEFYTIAVDNATPYNVYGGLQDNGSVYGPSDFTPEYGLDDPWRHIAGGDGFFVFPDPDDRDTVYYEFQFGNISRQNLATGEARSLMPKARLGQPALRFNWMTPFIISRYNSHILYCGANKLFRSFDRGDTWWPVSPDLTTQPGPDRQGDVPYGTISTIAESPLRPDLLYVGTDDGNVWVSRNGGADWTPISATLPDHWVSRVTPSAVNEGTVYVSLTAYRDDDFRTFLYKSVDYGTTWQDIGGGLPAESVNVIREDPANGQVLYVGTDLGVYASLDAGASWISLCADLPTSAVHDLVIQPRENDLVIGTHGRSAWVTSALPIQHYTEVAAKGQPHLFAVKPGQRPGQHGDGWALTGLLPVQAYYWRADAADIEISIRDKAGETVRHWTQSAAAGLTRIEWDVSVEGKNNSVFWQFDKVYARPGTYTLVVTAGGRSVEAPVVIQPSRRDTDAAAAGESEMQEAMEQLMEQ